MPKQKIVQTFTGGLAGDMPSWLVPNSMVADCQNFLFERGELKSRPAVHTGNSTLGAGSVIDSVMAMFPPIAGSSSQLYGTYKTSASDSTMRLFRIQPFFTASATSIIIPPTEATNAVPAGLVGGFHPTCAQYDNKTYIYGMYDAGNNPILLQVDNATHVATSITLPGAVGAGLAFGRPYPICEHLSRILIADPGLPGITFPTIYWSKIGDPTVWTGHFTTGNVRLQEASDGIRAMGVMKNMVIIARPTGFHVGVPTGNGSNPYDWKAITRLGQGCIYPESFIIYGDLCFFVGQSNVYMYDMQSVTAIGDGITGELFTWLTWKGFGVKAFITETYNWKTQAQLHLIPTFSPTTYTNGGAAGTIPSIDLANMPHFVFDLAEKKWSRHIYDGAVNDTYPLEGFPMLWDAPIVGNPNTGARPTFPRPCIIRRPAAGPSQYMMWDPFTGNGCESVQTFTTGTFVPGEDPSVEMKLDRFMFVARSMTDNLVVAVELTYMQGNVQKTANFNFTIVSSGIYSRVWVNKVVVGNLFEFKFTIPANSSVQVRQILFEFDEKGQEVRV